MQKFNFWISFWWWPEVTVGILLTVVHETHATLLNISALYLYSVFEIRRRQNCVLKIINDDNFRQEATPKKTHRKWWDKFQITAHYILKFQGNWTSNLQKIACTKFVIKIKKKVKSEKRQKNNRSVFCWRRKTLIC